jgi:hypothetical protein
MIRKRNEGRRAISVLWLYYTEWFSFVGILWPVIFNLGCANTVVL